MHARVRDLARDRVLEDVFVFAVELRVRTTANEIALRERLKRGFAASEERPHRTVPEDTSDHGRRLQRVLLSRLEQVDPGSNDPVNRVGKAKLAHGFSGRPAGSSASQYAAVD